MPLTKGLNNRKAITLTARNLRSQLPDGPVVRFIAYEVEMLHGDERRTVFDIAEFSGIMRTRKSLKWLRDLRGRGINPLEVYVEY